MQYSAIAFTLLLALVSAVHHSSDLNIFGRHRLPLPKPRSDAGEVTEDWIDQKLDHFDPTIATTWKQRYHMNPNYYSPGGPIFLYINGEMKADPVWVQGGFMIDLVAQHGGLAFQLEHRFYGQSHPTDSLSTSNLVYLTTEQAIADIAYFIQTMNNQYGDAKWIVVGGSYAGILSALMRMKYPDLVRGAISSGAPMKATANFSGYFEVVGSVLKRSNPPCYDEVENITKEMHELLQSEDGILKFTEVFNLCQPMDPSKVNDVYELQNIYWTKISGAVQYDTYTLSATSQLCTTLKDTENGATTLEIFANLWNQESCKTVYFEILKFNYGSETWDTDSADRAWLYQQCTEYGFFTTTDSSNQPFSDGVPLSFYVDKCTLIFGESFSRDRIDQGVAKTNALLGNLHPNVSNVVFTYGSADPWHVLGILEDLSPSAPAIVIEDFTHGWDLQNPQENDPPQMKAAHERIRSLINEWLQD